MAAGDKVAINMATATKDNFNLRYTGIDGDFPLESYQYDQATDQWQATPVGGYPNLNHLNGSPDNPGLVQIVTANAPNQLANMLGGLVQPGLVLASRPITIAPPTVASTITAVYVSGLGTSGDPITSPSDLTGNTPIVISITSVEV